MVTVISRQRIWERHEYDLDEDQYAAFRKLPKDEKQDFLDSIGGTGAEFECDELFKFYIKEE